MLEFTICEHHYFYTNPFIIAKTINLYIKHVIR